jgi:hypothetical protein
MREFNNFDKDKRTSDGNESIPMFVRELVRCCNFPFMKVEESKGKTSIPPHPTSKKVSALMDHVN